MVSDTNLPFGSEFSPSQIELPVLLEVCMKYSGNKAAIEDYIQKTFFKSHGRGNQDNKNKLAMNCRLGLKAYGIIDDKSKMTDLGIELYNLRLDTNKLYSRFAKHILLELNGMAFIQCIRDMTLAMEHITLTTLRKSCAERQIYYPSGGKHPSIMRLWLEKAGIFAKKSWNINNHQVDKILGLNDNMEALRSLTLLQRIFLQTLINTGITEPQPANRIKKIAEATYSVNFPEKSLPKEVLNNLVEKGFISIQKTTTGRGAKPFLVSPTDKLNKEIVSAFLDQLRKQTDPKLVDLLCKPMPEILHDLKSSNKYIAGLSLEALAFKLMRIIGLDYIATRVRSENTGGAEVDLIFEASRLVFSRWQVQCKNTSHVTLEDIAKEIGLIQLLKSNVIVIISTGKISADARRYANIVMKDTNLSIVMIDGEDILKIAKDPAQIINVFMREAKSTQILKKLKI